MAQRKALKHESSVSVTDEQRAKWRASYHKRKAENPEAMRAKGRRAQTIRRLRYPEKLKNRDRARHLKNREKNLQRMRDYYQANKAAIDARRKRNYHKREAANNLSKLETLVARGEIGGAEFVRRYTAELVTHSGLAPKKTKRRSGHSHA